MHPLPCVQGFGNVGAYAAEIFTEHGGKVCFTCKCLLKQERGLSLLRWVHNKHIFQLCCFQW